MTTGAKVFLASSAFGAAVALGYWVVASEPAGTALLIALALAPLLVAAFLWRIGRGPRRPPSDQPGAGPGPSEEVGTFVASSAWPVIFALASMLVVAGLVFGVWLLLPAGVLFAIAAIGFVRE